MLNTISSWATMKVNIFSQIRHYYPLMNLKHQFKKNLSLSSSINDAKNVIIGMFMIHNRGKYFKTIPNLSKYFEQLSTKVDFHIFTKADLMNPNDYAHKMYSDF